MANWNQTSLWNKTQRRLKERSEKSSRKDVCEKEWVCHFSPTHGGELRTLNLNKRTGSQKPLFLSAWSKPEDISSVTFGSYCLWSEDPMSTQDSGLSLHSAMASRWTLPGSRIGKDSISKERKRLEMETVNGSLPPCKLGLFPVMLLFLSFFYLHIYSK